MLEFKDTLSPTDEVLHERIDRFISIHDAPKDADISKYKHAGVPEFTRKYAQKDYRNRQFAQAGRLRFMIGTFAARDWLLSVVVGYGYQPIRSLGWLLGLILVGFVFAHQTWKTGDFAPNSDIVLESTEWQRLSIGAEAVPNPADTWSDEGERGQDYATFNPIYYAADIVIPIISLGQEDAWAPSTNREIWGKLLWFFNPFLTLMGWVVTAIGAAAVTGVIRKD